MSDNRPNFSHHFLLASPNIDDDIFKQSLIYICRQDKHGTLGLIINKPLANHHLSKLLEELEIPVTADNLYKKMPLDGGPVSPEVGFVLHLGQPVWVSSFAITENVCITTSRDILFHVGAGGLQHFELCLGHSSWRAGQLEQEIARGDWLVMPADNEILFNTPPNERWQTAVAKLGIDFDKFTMETGNA